MKLYTSYWYQVRFFPRNLICLSTVVYPPKYIVIDSTGRPAIVVDCWPLKPNRSCNRLCNGQCNPKHPHDCKFLRLYRAQLEQINFPAFVNSLEKLKLKIKEQEKLTDINFAFIVYESTNNPCSERVIIQDWFKNNNIFIEEWTHD